MKDNAMVSRIGSGGPILLGALLLIFFFLPWVNLAYEARAFGQASGWQLTAGDISPVKDPPKGIRLSQREEDQPKARPWFVLGLLAPGALLATGAVGLAGRCSPGAAGKIVLVLALVGITVVILAANVDYAKEMAERYKARLASDQGAQMADGAIERIQQAMRDKFKTRGTIVLWAALGLNIVAALSGARGLMGSKR